MTFSSIDTRLANFLSDKLGQQNDNEIQITHQEIANQLGTAREVITRTLKQFEKQGLVSLSRGTITVKNPAELSQLCAPAASA